MNCPTCLDHYRPDFPDIPLAGSETLNTAHCQHCHTRAEREAKNTAFSPSPTEEGSK